MKIINNDVTYVGDTKIDTTYFDRVAGKQNILDFFDSLCEKGHQISGFTISYEHDHTYYALPDSYDTYEDLKRDFQNINLVETDCIWFFSFWNGRSLSCSLYIKENKFQIRFKEKQPPKKPDSAPKPRLEEEALYERITEVMNRISYREIELRAAYVYLLKQPEKQRITEAYRIMYSKLSCYDDLFNVLSENKYIHNAMRDMLDPLLNLEHAQANILCEYSIEETDDPRSMEKAIEALENYFNQLPHIQEMREKALDQLKQVLTN